MNTHAVMDKVRQMDLYPVVPDEGKFAGSKRLARAMEIASLALSAPDRYEEKTIAGQPSPPAAAAAGRAFSA